jgi:ATP-binding cassette subfamily C protein CydD
MHLAVDSIAATDGLVSRFLPLRAASGLSPLVIALAVAPASWVASSILLATLVPFILAMALAGGAAAQRAEAQHVALTRLSGLFVDRLRTLPTIVGFSAEERIARHLGDAALDVARRTMAVLSIAFASSAILEFFAALSVAMVAVYCGFSLLGLLPFTAPEHLTGVRAFYTLALAPEFYLTMRRLAAAYHDKQLGEAATAAMAAEMNKLPPLPPPLATPTQLAGHGVMLAHPEGAVIGPLDWTWLSPGLHAISGPTGGGKSSLLLGLVGQVPVAAGEITADSVPFTPGALNGVVGWAGQQVALLPGSLRDNLAMGNADAPTMMACLEVLGLGSMLAQRGGLTMGVDHRGSGLSGGERRRIGLARAILSGRPILLLDEPTAELDVITAGAIRALLRELANSRMVVVATHDADLVAMAGTRLAIAP